MTQEKQYSDWYKRTVGGTGGLFWHCVSDAAAYEERGSLAAIGEVVARCGDRFRFSWSPDGIGLIADFGGKMPLTVTAVTFALWNVDEIVAWLHERAQRIGDAAA